MMALIARKLAVPFAAMSSVIGANMFGSSMRGSCVEG